MTLVTPPFGTFMFVVRVRSWPHCNSPRMESHMKRSLLVLSLALAAGAAQAHDAHRSVHGDCDIDSRFSLDADNGSYIFSQASGHPGRIVLDNGDLLVDGRKADLTATDQARVREFEGELDLLLPQARTIATEAIGIAFDALDEVARALASHPRETIAELDRSRAIALREVSAHPGFLFGHDDDAIDAVIEPVVARFVPEIAGGAVSLAFHAIFASDRERDAMEARMNQMEKTLDQRIDARAEALEPLADAMCVRLKRMDALDNALDYRLPGGGRLELLSIDSKATAQSP
jgi:hypothetical protein